MLQWRNANETIMADLASLTAQDWYSVRYEDILRDPAATLKALCAFAEAPFGEKVRATATAPLRWSRYTLSPPEPDKWRKNETAIAQYLPDARTTIDKLAAFSNTPPA